MIVDIASIGHVSILADDEGRTASAVPLRTAPNICGRLLEVLETVTAE